MKWITAVFVAMAMIAGATTTSVAQGSSSACSDRAFRQLNFWVGVWDVRWERSPNQAAGSGANTVTRELGGCVIEENFEGGPSTSNLIGRSVSTFDAQVGHWRQTWVDNKGGYYALIGGREGDQFILVNSRLHARAPYLRMVFEDITPTSLTWRWQNSTDEGQTWRDQWVIYYTRRE